MQVIHSVLYAYRQRVSTSLAALFHSVHTSLLAVYVAVF